MANVNKVLLIGRLTRDVEVRRTPAGAAVAEFGLAVNRTWKGNDGQQQEETTFVDVTAWGRTAELAGQYLAKGRQVFIEGRLKLDQWDDRNSGQKRQKLSVVIENMQFLEPAQQGGDQGRGGNQQGGNQRGGSQRQQNEPAYSRPRDQGQPPADDGGYGYGAPPPNDDIPF